MDHHQHHAHRAGWAAPEPAHKGEDHRGGSVVFRAEIKADDANCASVGQAVQLPPAKAFATLQARLALAGWTLIQAEQHDGANGFFASRWNRTRDLADLVAVAAFADQVGAPS